MCIDLPSIILHFGSPTENCYVFIFFIMRATNFNYLTFLDFIILLTSGIENK
jgi:hypothetical protein